MRNILTLCLIESKFPAAPHIPGVNEKEKQDPKKIQKPRAEDFPVEVKGVLSQCTSELPSERPTVTVLSKKYFRMVGHSGTVIGDTLKRMERYSEDLEESVIARTQELLTERQKCDALLCEMLPK